MAGAFTTFTGNFSVSVQQNAGGAPLIAGQPNAVSFSNNPQWRNSYMFGTGSQLANQASDLIVTGGTSATVNLDLSAAFSNILGNAAATWARIKGVLFKLLSPADDSTNGTLCSGLLIGNGSTPWQGFFGATTGTILLNGGTATVPGDWVAGSTDGATGWVVTGSAKILKMVNQDASNTFALRLTLIGADA